MSTPAHDVAQFIADNVAGFILGTNLKVGDEEIPVPKGRDALAVYVANTLGIDAAPFVDGGDKSRIERPSVNILVRGDKDDRRTGEAIAVMLAVDVLDMATIGPWLEVRVTGDGALSLGPDDDGFPRWSINLRLRGCFELFPVFGGAAAIPGLIDAAFLATLSQQPRTRRNRTFTAVAVLGDRLWAAFPQTFNGPTSAPFQLFDGLTARAAIPTTLMAASVPVLVRGASVLYDVWASTAAVPAGAHVAKLL